MTTDFRPTMDRISTKALKWIEDYFDDKQDAEGKIKESLKLLSYEIKLRHMEQIKEQGDKSLALRLIKFLPKDEKLRNRYIELTNPEIKPLLLEKPTKVKGLRKAA